MMTGQQENLHGLNHKVLQLEEGTKIDMLEVSEGKYPKTHSRQPC